MKPRPCTSCLQIVFQFAELDFRWAPTDRPWRRLDDDGVEVPRPERDERVSNCLPFRREIPLIYSTRCEGWNIGGDTCEVGRGGAENDHLPPLPLCKVRDM